MRTKIIIISLAFILALILSFFVVKLIRKKERNKLLKGVNDLEIKKNNLSSLPVLVELSKIEEIAKSEQLEEKINEFKDIYDDIKENKLEVVNDMIFELESQIEIRDIKEYYNRYSDIEIMLDEIDSSLNNILNEIEEISSYEEKYRNIITKLKAKYRYLEHSYEERETLFKDISESIKMQFENITKRFNDFDKVMEEKLYNEVVLVVKSIDTMIDNLDVVIRELPDILLLLDDLIPGRIKDLDMEYNKMLEEGFSLGYLDYQNNIENIKMRENDIHSRARVLNIENSLFDLRTILEYLDGLFSELQEERDAKAKFDKLDEAFKNKKEHLESIVKDIYSELDDIKAMYHLTENDLEIIDELNLKLSGIIKDYKKMHRDIKKKDEPYQKHNITINELLERINNISDEFDNALRTLGSFYEDEKRSKEELLEMKKILKNCKSNIRNNKLPVIYNNYFVEEEEATDAIGEVEKELNNKPIVIKNLNIRVETAKDLTLKLNHNVNEMIKYAEFIEILFVYSNKYRDRKDVDKSLFKVENLFYKGNYKESFELLLKIVKSIDEELYNKVNKLCKN